MPVPVTIGDPGPFVAGDGPALVGSFRAPTTGTVTAASFACAVPVVTVTSADTWTVLLQTQLDASSTTTDVATAPLDLSTVLDENFWLDIPLPSGGIVLAPGDFVHCGLLPGVSPAAVDGPTFTLVWDDGTGGGSGSGTGSGTIPVDQDTGGTDALRYVTAGGVGIPRATILAYLATDYAAGHTGSAYVVASTSTGPDGRWAAPLLLDPGTYVLAFGVPGQFGTDTATITVA
jgi:hypothetical protein